MGAQNTSNQTAFMGDVHDLARLVAAALLPELRALAQVDPPMSIRDLAEWTGWGESHIRDLVARKAIPFHNRALPGSEFISKMQRRKSGIRQVIITTHSYDLLNTHTISPKEVLVLETGPEGTSVKPADTIDLVKKYLDAGFTPAEAVTPHTAPKEIKKMNQLNLFDRTPESGGDRTTLTKSTPCALPAQGVCVSRATIVQLCTIFATFGA